MLMFCMISRFCALNRAGLPGVDWQGVSLLKVP